MTDEIKVSVNSYGDHRPLMLVYRDPITGRRVAKSSGTTNEQAAERAAAVLQDALNSGRHVGPNRVTWQTFRERYEAERLPTLAAGSGNAARAVFNHVERLVDPDMVGKLTAAVISRFSATLRLEGLTDATVAKNLRHLKAALRWGQRVGLLAKAPAVELPKRAKGERAAKGRPITAEEFDRMVEAAPKVRPDDAADWQRFLTGLWLSGLRLGEGVALSWDDRAAFAVDLGGKHPRFGIAARAQKSRKDETVPMTPDFATWLLEGTQGPQRAGRVFRLLSRTTGKPMTVAEAGRIVSEIGERAGVVVGRDGEKVKYASAHDLRRAFGTRWASRVKPAVLQRLMRHANIATTLDFYVDLDADDMAAELWAGCGSGWASATASTARVEDGHRHRLDGQDDGHHLDAPPLPAPPAWHTVQNRDRV